MPEYLVYHSPPELKEGVIKVIAINPEFPDGDFYSILPWGGIRWGGYIFISDDNRMRLKRCLFATEKIEIGDYLDGYHGEAIVCSFLPGLEPIAEFRGSGPLFYGDVELTKMEKLPWQVREQLARSA